MVLLEAWKKRENDDDDNEIKKKKTQQMSTVNKKNSLCQPCGKTRVRNLPADEREVCSWPLRTSFFLTRSSSADTRPQPGAGVHWSRPETDTHNKFTAGPFLSMKAKFSSVQDGIYTLAKAHMHSTPPLRSFPNIAFKTVPMSDWQWPTLILFKEDRLVLPLSMALSSKQSTMWCPWLCARR